MGACCETNPRDLNEQEIRNIRAETPDDFALTASEAKIEAADWEKVEEIWRDYDIDRNGTLEKDEAFAFLRVMLKEYTGKDPTDADLERNFKIMDEDESGDINKQEAQKFLKGF